jgi:hypothetical protein
VRITTLEAQLAAAVRFYGLLVIMLAASSSPPADSCLPARLNVTNPGAETVDAHSNGNCPHEAGQRFHGNAQALVVAECVRDGEKTKRDEEPGVEAKAPGAETRIERVVSR